MKIAVAGKGGSGKTTVAGTVARVLARRGYDVLALDADTNPMLGISLGLGPEETERLVGVRQGLDTGEIPHQPTVKGMIETFGNDAPDGVRFVVASRIENIDPGCQCCGVSPERLLGEFDSHDVVIADLEAGVGTLNRLPADTVDTLLVIVEPTVKSMAVGRSILALADNRHPGTDTVVVANRVRDSSDAATVATGVGAPVLAVPEDSSISLADRVGSSPIDQDPNSPAIVEIGKLVDGLEGGIRIPLGA